MFGRATMFFKQGEFGWSETHWHQNINITTGALYTASLGLANARAALLDSQSTLNEVRVSQDTVFRDSLVETFIPPLSGAGFGGGGAFGLQPFDVLSLRAEGTSQYRKIIYLGGIESSFWSNPFVGISDPGWLAYFNIYKAELLANWGFKAQVSPDKTMINIPPPTGYDITAVDPGLPNVYTITHPGPGFATHQKVRIRGVRMLNPRTPRVAGNYVAQVTTATTTIISQNHPPGQQYDPASDGFIWAETVDVIPYTDVIQDNFTHRKRGRPFDEPRGRSRRT
jgi:hypothetical protein